MGNDKLLHFELTEKVIGAAIDVMRELGSGFLENVYENALIVALRQKGLQAQQQVPLTVKFRGVVVGDYVADVIVEDKVLVELKTVTRIQPEHLAQTINYLNATGIDVGLLINFHQKKVQWKRLYRSNEQSGSTRPD